MRPSDPMPRPLPRQAEPPEKIAIAVLSAGGSFGEAMQMARIPLEQVKAAWAKWTQGAQRAPALANETRRTR